MKQILGYFQAILCVVATCLLAACGGGDSSVPLVGVSANTLQLNLSAANVTAAAPVTVTALVLTPTGAPVVGQTVGFSTPIGSLTSGAASGATVTAVTNASGNATVQLTAGSVAGTGAVISYFTDSSGNQRRVTQGFTTAGDAATGGGSGGGGGTVVYSITLSLLNSGGVATGSAAAPISAANPGTVRAVVLRNGVATPNQIVNFSSSLGTINPGSRSALTDASGAAFVSLRAGLVAGAGELTARFANNEGSATAAQNFTTLGDDSGGGGAVAGMVLTLQLLDQAGVTPITSITGAAPGLLKARLTDNSAVPVPQVGKVISFRSTLGAINPAAGTALTDSSGYAIVNLSAGTIGGAGTAQATYASTTTSSTVGFSTDGSGGGNNASLTMLGIFTSGGAPLPSNTVTTSTPGVVKVIVRDAAGVAVPNQLVSFTTTLGTLTPASGSRLTDASGVASITVTAGSTDDVGVVRASTNINNATLSANLNFEVVQDTLDIGKLITGTFTRGQLHPSTVLDVPQGSTIPIRADIYNVTAGALYTTPVAVAFTASCAGSLIDATVTSQSGQALATYKAGAGCTTDTITATTTLTGASKTAGVAINIAPLPANAIDFISATPKTVGIKGSAGLGRSETSSVTFRVKDSSGSPVSGAAVSFALSTSVGGITLSPQGATPTTATTISDVNGFASVTIAAGTVPTPVRVSAVLDSAPGVTAVSSSLSVSTGLPTQNAFSLSVAAHNPAQATFGVDGHTIQVTARGADQFNNPIPDGTTVQFTTELGSIEPSCETVNGACSVNWISGGNRLVNYDPVRATRAGSGGKNDRYGRTTIMATTIGEETFLDNNGNNSFDVGESLYEHLDEAFRDDNETGTRDDDAANLIVEKFLDYDSSGAFTLGLGDGKYNGILCGAAAKAAGNCQSLLHVRASQVVVLPTFGAQIYVFQASDVNHDATDWVDGSYTGAVTTPVSPYSAFDSRGQVTAINYAAAAGTTYFKVLVADFNGNAPAAGTTVTMDTGYMKAVGPTTCTVPDTTEPWFCGFAVIKPTPEPLGERAPVRFTVLSVGVTTPASIVTLQ